MLFALALTIALASPSPSPVPSPTPTPSPQYSLDGAFSLYSVHTNGINATGSLDTPNNHDLASRTEDSNALLSLTKNTGVLRGNVMVGAYAFPVVGGALNPTTQPGANAYLFGFVPQAYLSYVPNAHLTISAGKLPSLLGQESGFTYQDLNVQRGIVWAAETTFDRGVRVQYANGKLTSQLGYDDGFYSGNAGRALEGLVGWQFTPNTTAQFAFVVPGANTPGNVTSAIANKREYDLMLTQQCGKLQLLPYVLFVDSPATAKQGYLRDETALGAVLLANYAFNATYSVGARVESFANHSASSDLSLNADLVGFGPGSRAATWTITPSYHPGPFFARAEFSSATVHNATPGIAFGPLGIQTNQTRALLELGVQF